MATKVSRRTVDLSQYPDLVVIYLGMRVNRVTGLKTLLGFGPRIAKSVEAHPDGLLLHENFVFSLFPMHAGMRQYSGDFRNRAISSLVQGPRSLMVAWTLDRGFSLGPSEIAVAGYGDAAEVDAVGPASGVVEEFFARLGRDGLLA